MVNGLACRLHWRNKFLHISAWLVMSFPPNPNSHIHSPSTTFQLTLFFQSAIKWKWNAWLLAVPPPITNNAQPSIENWWVKQRAGSEGATHSTSFFYLFMKRIGLLCCSFIPEWTSNTANQFSSWKDKRMKWNGLPPRCPLAASLINFQLMVAHCWLWAVAPPATKHSTSI